MKRSARPLESADTIREILVKLPTKDVARCRSVSRLWRNVVADPSFSSLHAKAVASHVWTAPETLLVTETREPGRPDEASFFSVSSLKPMPYRVTIPSGYSLSNVCNGLLCFAVERSDAAPLVCNPVTGETATFPKAPPPVGLPGGTVHHVFALGFSPSTKEHKLFRFSFSHFNNSGRYPVDQSVCTLDGAGGGWRQRSCYPPSTPLHTFPPLVLGGKLYLVTTGRTWPETPREPDRLLEVDVASEAHRMFPLPFGADVYHSCWDPLVNAFEMSGRLCLAVNLLKSRVTTITKRKLQFWVLSSPPLDQQFQKDDGKLCWDLCYSFYVDGNYCFDQPRSAWFDHHEMTLWYKDYEGLFKHGTRGRAPEPSPEAECPQCDRLIQFPPKPSNCRWHIYGGYRPSLLSPLTLAPPPSSWDGEEERQEFEKALLLKLRDDTNENI